MMQSLWVIIPAAGVGQRMQSECPKQYLSLAGMSILDRTISIFIGHPKVEGVLVGISKEDSYWPQSKWFNHSQVRSYEGGEERSDTVQKGLRILLESLQILDIDVLVHDAARPLLSKQALDKIIDHDSDQGALLALPARDTVKLQSKTFQVNRNQVDKTIDRNTIWLAQTPQKFPLKALFDALVKVQLQGVSITDECSAMEFIGWHPDLIVGESSNIKVTIPEDLLIAEALLSHLSHSTINCD